MTRFLTLFLFIFALLFISAPADACNGVCNQRVAVNTVAIAQPQFIQFAQPFVSTVQLQYFAIQQPVQVQTQVIQQPVQFQQAIVQTAAVAQVVRQRVRQRMTIRRPRQVIRTRTIIR